MKTGGNSPILGQVLMKQVAHELPPARTRHAALNADQPASSAQQSLDWLLAAPPAETPQPASTPDAPVSTASGPLREHRHPLANREIELAGVRIGFHHAHAKRRSIGMSVGPQGLQVRAPRWVTQAQLQAVLRERAPWIVDKLQQQLARVASQAPAQRWGHGHSVQVLGREVVLRSQPTARAGRSATANASLVRLNAQPAIASGTADMAHAESTGLNAATAPIALADSPVTTTRSAEQATSAQAQDIAATTSPDARVGMIDSEYSPTDQQKLAAGLNTVQHQLDWITQTEAGPAAQSVSEGAPTAPHEQQADAPMLGDLPRTDAQATAHAPAPAPAPENCAAPAASAPASQLALDVALPADAPEAQWQAAVLRWLQTLARRHFTARLDQLAPVLGVRWSRLSLTNARTRWGSASSDGSIRLHWRLMQLAPELADYVIVHELAHLHEMNHSPRFWAIVAAAMPDYQRHQQALKQIRLAPLD